MQIIPVIDLKKGIGVHAKQGNRAFYQPLTSTLCTSPDVFDVITAFQNLYPFPTFYLADLDALMHEGDNSDLIAEIFDHFPDTQFWVDSGYPLYPNRFRTADLYLPVLGTESFSENAVDQVANFGQEFILSLDYSKEGQIGATSLFTEDALWPERIIVMTLARVGSNLGPDLDRLAAYRKKLPLKQFIAAGGIRDGNDLEALSQIGVKHALVASALHNGHITANDIEFFQAKKYPA